MKPKYNETIRRILSEIVEISNDLPKGKRNQISNRCYKLSSTIRKINNMQTDNHMTAETRNDETRFIARQAIFEAMTGGRKLSQMDCREFEVEDMRTPMSHMRTRFESAGFALKSQWIKTPKGRRIKEYWLEREVAS